MQLKTRAIAVVCLLWLVGGATDDAWADAASGTWTGTVNGELNYYYERSTRVYMPAAGVKLEAPNGIRLRANYLVDVITSASIAAGRSEDVLRDEFRHEFRGGTGIALETPVGPLQLDLTGRYSTENDYESMSATADAALALHDKNTVLRLSLSRLFDEIRSNSDTTFAATLKSWAASASWEQVVNPWMVFTLGYQFGHQHGYVGNPYRFAQREAAPERERPPRKRVRHGLSARLATFVPTVDIAVHLMYRAYLDSWDMQAQAPEIRIYREFGEWLLLRLRYRYYSQNRAEFYRDTYTRDWTGPLTSDPKLAALTSHTLGMRIELSTPFLSRTILDFAEDSVIYLQLDRVVTGIAFGNQVTGTGGALWRF